MRILRSKNIFGLLFAVLLAIPMIDIAVRCIYVQSNKNAKDSYSASYENTTLSINSNNASTLYIQNQIVTIKWGNQSFGSRSGVYGFSDISLDVNNLLSTQGINYVGFEMYTSSSTFMYFYDDLGGQHLFQNYKSKIDGFTYTVDLTNYNRIAIYSYVNAYTIQLVQGKLDNAFEYSVNQFITNNNFGKLNFFNWFTSLFFENNAKANTYMQFANWYMNYALLISLAYILFMVLMWFINFVRKLLDKGMSFGEGSY